MNGPASARLRVVVFSGGRGTGTIADALLKHPEIELTLLVNAYDDGLSTGRIRAFVPGMLGPSDVRKCCTRMMSTADRSDRALRDLLENRLRPGMASSEGHTLLDALARLDLDAVARIDEGLATLAGSLRTATAQSLGQEIAAFDAYARAQSPRFDFGDCAVGNIVIAGAYLARGRDFNAATQAMNDLTETRGRVLNVTRGENLVLLGLKVDGTILRDEATVVGPQSGIPLRDIYLLRDYLTSKELAALADASVDEIDVELRRRTVFPEANPECLAALAAADIIIFGPGTQHSSLYPSYMTKGIGEAIRDNRSAEKIFVANIRRDQEIQGETAATLVRKLVRYLQRHGEVELAVDELASTFFVNAEPPASVGGSLLPASIEKQSWAPGTVVRADWEATRGQHLGGRVVDEIVSLVNIRSQRQLARYHYMVSIVVPCLDEAHTVERVLRELVLLDVSPFGLAKEVVFVDGGSTDGSWEIANHIAGVRCIRSDGSGRGRALRKGVAEATGDIVVFFPSDGEYVVDDVPRLVRPILRDDVKVVFGNRTARVADLSAHIREIYPRNRLGYLMGKYGNITLNIVSSLVHNRHVSDPLTGLKAFERRLLSSLELEANGLDIEGELVAKLARRGILFLEIPIEFHPRRQNEGKSSSFLDGLRALAALVRG